MWIFVNIQCACKGTVLSVTVEVASCEVVSWVDSIVKYRQTI
jgi:hypothetical protein